MTEQKMREAFEAWWPSLGQTIGKVAAWEAWQAALSQRDAQEPVGITDEHLDEIWLQHNPLTADHIEYARAVLAAAAPLLAAPEVTLTIGQIKELADYAGLAVSASELDDEIETEITISVCAVKGVLDDDGSVKHFSHTAHFTDYPDEGCMPLGPEIDDASASKGGSACD